MPFYFSSIVNGTKNEKNVGWILIIALPCLYQLYLIIDFGFVFICSKNKIYFD